MLISQLEQIPGPPGGGGLALDGFAGRVLVIVTIAALAAALWRLSDSGEPA